MRATFPENHVILLLLLSWLGGVLTIVSPCILPVPPFVFARADRPFLRSGLPLLAGMSLTFAGIATLAAVGGGWAVHANQIGRIAAMVLLTLFGLTLLFGSLADRLTRPLVALGNRLTESAGDSAGESIGASLLLGVATGLLWSPCAGPILGLILTGAALRGASANTTLLLLAYAAGAATSLAAALLLGGRVFAAMKNSLGAGEWIRRGLGVAVLLGVVAIAFGLDTGILSRLSLAGTAGIDSPPLRTSQLRGKVVLVDFWTYSCINCLRALPYVRAWAQKYKDHGMVVIGVHAPEFAFEKDIDNVRRAMRDLGVRYPVALDNNSERVIQTLLKEAGDENVPAGIVNPDADGARAAADNTDMQSPETYIGYARAAGFAPGEAARDQSHVYATTGALMLNQWGVTGAWTVAPDKAVLNQAPGKIVFRFHARDLHLVLGPAAAGRSVRFRVTIDGSAPGAAHGVDTDNGSVTAQRLYQLVRQTGGVTDHTFAIEFLDPGVQAFAFTFG